MLKHSEKGLKNKWLQDLGDDFSFVFCTTKLHQSCKTHKLFLSFFTKSSDKLRKLGEKRKKFNKLFGRFTAVE